jgi:hypothetical protein
MKTSKSLGAKLTREPILFLKKIKRRNGSLTFKVLTKSGSVFGVYPTEELAKGAAFAEARRHLKVPRDYRLKHKQKLETFERMIKESKAVKK